MSGPRPRILILAAAAAVLAFSACSGDAAIEEPVVDFDKPLVEQLPDDLPEGQQLVLADKVVTPSEMRGALDAWQACVTAEGMHAEWVWFDKNHSWNFELAPAGFEPDAEYDEDMFERAEWKAAEKQMDACEEKHVGMVGMVWQDQIKWVKNRLLLSQVLACEELAPGAVDEITAFDPYQMVDAYKGVAEEHPEAAECAEQALAMHP